MQISKSVATPHAQPRALFFFELSLFWFAVSFLWSGLITTVIQGRVEEFAPAQKDLYLGYTLASGALISTVVCIAAGALSDRSRSRFGRRRPFITVGALLTVPALFLVGRADSIPALIVAICLVQLWINVATAPYQALIPDQVPKAHQGAASAWMGMSTLLGTSIGLVSYAWLATQPNGLMKTMMLVSGLLLVTMALTLWRVRETPFQGDDGGESAPQKGLMATVVDSFRVSPRDNPDFFWLIGSRFMINMGFYSATEFLLYYVTDTLRAPNPKATVTNFFLITTVASLIGNFPAGLLADRVSKKLVVYVSIAITAVAALIFLLAGSIEVATYAAVVFGIGYGAFLAVDWALATNLLPERDEAKWMGVWHVAFTVPQVIAPVVGGLIAYNINRLVAPGAGYRAVMFTVLIYLVIGALLVHPIRERKN